MLSDEFLIGEFTELLLRTSTMDQPQTESEELALDSQAEATVVRWQMRFDASYLVYNFTLGERCYWFAWESYFDETHRQWLGESVWYDSIAPRARLEVRYRASEPTRHSARFGDHEIQGRFLQIRSTQRAAFRGALATANYPTLAALVDGIRAIEQDDLTFLLLRQLFGQLAGLSTSGLSEQIAALNPRYCRPVDFTDPHDGACHRFFQVVQMLLETRPGDARRIAEACFEPMALFTALTYASHYSLDLANGLMTLFEQCPETAELVLDFATFALVLTPADPHYDETRSHLVGLLRAARR